MRVFISIISAITILVIAVAACQAIGIDRDESGNIKVTMTSFFDDEPEKEGDDREARYKAAEELDDKDYRVDIIGRKVPVKTKRAGTAIETR